MPDISNDRVNATRDKQPAKDDPTRPASPEPRDRQPDDAGRTQGGGNLGHEDRPERKSGNATGQTDDPVMPKDDATLKTKI